MIDGKSLKRELRQILNESSTSGYLDDKTTYDYLYAAACEFIKRTACCTTTQSITTTASTSEYNINSNYLGLYLRNPDVKFYVEYNDGASKSFPLFKPYEEIIYENDTSTASVPNHFTILDDNSNYSQITGTASSAGALSAGQCTLTDTSSSTKFANVNDGDTVHNTTDSAVGIVLSKTSSTALVTAMFDGTDNDWDQSDAYVIQPQNRFLIKMSPTPSTSSHTITVYYIERPAPVYSDYGIYRIPQEYKLDLIMYGAWLYKYRDSEPNFGDKYYTYFENEVKKAGYNLNKSLNRKNISISFMKR